MLRHTHTVYTLLEAAGALKMLDDPLIYTATQEILPDPTKTRAQVHTHTHTHTHTQSER